MMQYGNEKHVTCAYVPQLKREFAGELILLEESLEQERKHVQEEMKRLREELQEKHEAELSALRSDHDRETEKERMHFEEALNEERGKLKSLQAALDNDESKFSVDLVHYDQTFWKWNTLK